MSAKEPEFQAADQNEAAVAVEARPNNKVDTLKPHKVIINIPQFSLSKS